MVEPSLSRPSLDLSHYRRHGYQIFRSLFPAGEVRSFRERVLAEQDRHRGDLLSHPTLADVVFDPRLLAIATGGLNDRPIYFGDSATSIDGVPGHWHRDNPDKEDANRPDWAGDYPILRVGVYLQDHSRHSGGVSVRSDSFRDPARRAGQPVYGDTALGDAIVWNFRTLHRSATQLLRWPRTPLSKRLARLLPSPFLMPGDGRRVVLFVSYAADGPCLSRFIRYLRTRRYGVTRWQSSVYDPEILRRAEEAGLTVRDLRDSVVHIDPESVPTGHHPLPASEDEARERVATG